MTAGAFITFEGIEGAGKSTQIERLGERIRRRGRRVTLTREPGGTELGRALRGLLLLPTSTPMHSVAELFLYAADRAQHLTEVVGPALERGEVVLCDRYVDATLAYQGHGRGLGTESIRELHRRQPLNRIPDRTLLFDLDPEVGLARARRRDGESGLARTEGRFEQEQLDFHSRVRRGYLELAQLEPDRFRILDGALAPDVVERAIRTHLLDLVPELAEPRDREVR